MKSKVKDKAIKEIFGTFILIIAVIVLFRYEDIKGGFFPDSIHFEQTTGTVITSKMNYHVGVKGASGYRFIIEYEFKIHGIKHTSDKVNFGSKSFRRKKKAEKIIEKYPVGKEVVVYYETGNPDLAILEPQNNSNSEFFIVLAVLGSFILFLLAIVFQRYRKKRPQTKIIKSKK